MRPSCKGPLLLQPASRRGILLYRDPPAATLSSMEPRCTGTIIPASDIWVNTGSLFKLIHFWTPSPTIVDIWWLMKLARSAQSGDTHLQECFIAVIDLALLPNRICNFHSQQTDCKFFLSCSFFLTIKIQTRTDERNKISRFGENSSVC